jgi:hypothetical protein
MKPAGHLMAALAAAWLLGLLLRLGRSARPAAYADEEIIKVPHDYPTIQAAVDAAAGGAEIRVREGAGRVISVTCPISTTLVALDGFTVEGGNATGLGGGPETLSAAGIPRRPSMTPTACRGRRARRWTSAPTNGTGGGSACRWSSSSSPARRLGEMGGGVTFPSPGSILPALWRLYHFVHEGR